MLKALSSRPGINTLARALTASGPGVRARFSTSDKFNFVAEPLARQGSHFMPDTKAGPLKDTKGIMASVTGEPRLRNGAAVAVSRLTESDKAAVNAFYESLEVDTLGAAHGSYCALSSGLSGDTVDSAVLAMGNRFSAALKEGHVAMGMQDQDSGQLIGICFRQKPDSTGASETYGLTIADSHTGQGAAVLLKKAQFSEARYAGVTALVTHVGTSDMKGLGSSDRDASSATLTIVAITEKAAKTDGLAVKVELSHPRGSTDPTAREAVVTVRLDGQSDPA